LKGEGPVELLARVRQMLDGRAGDREALGESA
jgi:hypothetical protein